MKKLIPSKNNYIAFLGILSEEQHAINFYVMAIGETFVRMSLMEDAIITAMGMCDRIKVKSKLAADAKAWEAMVEKRTGLQASTLGSLIKILSDHKVAAEDIAYLRWVKERRDIFVHRFFHDRPWPGEAHASDCEQLTRQLQYLKLVFWRAGMRIFPILQRNGFVVIRDLGDAGSLIGNIGSILDPDYQGDL